MSSPNTAGERPKEDEMQQKIIGKTTTYRGDEHKYLKGYKVRIIAVLKGGAHNGEHLYLQDDAEVARHGGVTEDDRLEVQPWITQEGRWSWITSDPLAKDLVCFK